MSAIRLARGFTKRDKLIKFDGCYHGHADSLLVKAGSGALTFGNPDSAGVPAAFTQHTIVLPYNEQEALTAAFEANKNQIAGIIIEPVPGNADLPGRAHLSVKLRLHGRLPERPKGAVCKTVGSAYVGSNPTPATER